MSLQLLLASIILLLLFNKEKILKGGLIAQIKREISNLRRVRHPNIAQLFEVMAPNNVAGESPTSDAYIRGGELFQRDRRRISSSTTTATSRSPTSASPTFPTRSARTGCSTPSMGRCLAGRPWSRASCIMLLLLLCPLLFNPVHLAKAASPSIALPGCIDRCGNISIPYPFGIASGCYLADSFKINCSSNGTPTLLSGLELLQISVEYRTVDVMSPISWSCDDNGKSVTSPNDLGIINLASTSFSFSSTLNMFTAVGCNNLALLRRGDSTAGGCMSICEDGETLSTVNGSCTGINCCQSTIPYSLKFLNISITSGSGERDINCKYAYLVNQSWFYREVDFRNGNVSQVPEMGYVPVVLDWEVDYNTYAPILNNRSKELNSGRRPAACNSKINSSDVRCSCSYGFEGNPYVPNGCTDIDECSLGHPPVCLSQNDCVNTEGGYDCLITDPELKKSPTLIGGLIVGFGVVLGATGIWTLSKFWRKQRSRKRREKNFRRNGGLLLQEQLLSGEVNVEKVKMFSFKELHRATDHFNINRMLGQGGQGTVYKGMLADGRIVAVKRSKAGLDESKTREFINEVVILSQVNHRNVVKLLGCCLETEVPLLVYEFIPNGNLFELLQGHENDEDVQLTWDMRLKIGVEVSGSLAYLHSAASMPIYHRDIKSTNILLDEKYRAKVADFGISKSVTIDQTHVTTRVQGTFGYLDPEYFRSSQFTDKSDVYSFGVVLVELLTGLKPICNAGGEEEVRGLVYRFLLCMDEDHLFDIVDERIEVSGRREEIILVANLARRCLNWTGKERPSMKEVAVVLEGIQKSHQGPDASAAHAKQPAIMESDHWDFGFTSTNHYSSLDSTDIDSLVGRQVSSFSIN